MSAHDDWQVYQRLTNAGWRTKVMRGPWHVQTVLTLTKGGGQRKAARVIQQHPHSPRMEQASE